MSRGRWSALLPVGGLALLVAAGHPPADELPPVTPPPVEDRCGPEDPELAELSGLAADEQRWYAVPDGGSSLRVWVLDPRDCAERDVVTAEVNPYDVEDLALGPDGALWLADIGDNGLRRDTVALHRLAPDGTANLYRLTYPDGPHDAEALLLDRAGIPHVVTKELGPDRVYRPVGPLAEPAPTSLEQVATLQLGPTDTPGGPVGRAGSVLVTGGAVSADGQVVALRTYTDAYLYSVPDGDVVAALSTPPLRIPLPDEPQGEAIAVTPEGTLLSGSESPPEYEGNPPLRAVPGAVRLLGALPTPPLPSPVNPEASTTDETSTGIDGGELQAGQVAGGVVGGLVLGTAILLMVRRHRRARRG